LKLTFRTRSKTSRRIDLTSKKNNNLLDPGTQRPDYVTRIEDKAVLVRSHQKRSRVPPELQSHVAMVAKPKEVTEVVLPALGKSAEL
jgi:hypothetical protein